jgi:hypothetical protein
MTPEVVALMTQQNAGDIQQLKQSHVTLANSMATLVAEVKLAKWVVGIAFGVAQPVAIGVLIHYFTKG